MLIFHFYSSGTPSLSKVELKCHRLGCSPRCRFRRHSFHCHHNHNDHHNYNHQWLATIISGNAEHSSFKCYILSYITIAYTLDDSHTTTLIECLQHTVIGLQLL